MKWSITRILFVGLFAGIILGGALWCRDGACTATVTSFFNRIVSSGGEVLQKISDVSDVASTTPVGVINSAKQALNAVTTPGPLRAKTAVSSSPSTALTRSGVITLTNNERAKIGAEILNENTKLNAAALAKADDIFAKQYFEHVSPSGVGPGDLATSAGYEYIIEGENLALGGFASDQEIIDAWMASPGHRANILNTHYREIGVAVKQGTYEGRTVWVGVQEFGTPRSDCPEVNTELAAVIQTSKAQLAVVEAELTSRKQELDALPPGDSTHNTKVQEYNAIVRDYNALVVKVREIVAQYNAQVNAFNICIAEFQ